MQPGANTTYVHYRVVRATGPMSLEIKLFINYRDYHSTTIMNEWQPDIEPVGQGLRIQMFAGAVPFYLLSQTAEIEPRFDWYEDFYLSVEEYRGQADIEEDHIYAAKARATLEPGESLTMVASTETATNLDGETAYAERQTYEAELLKRYMAVQPAPPPAYIKQLVLAADQFVVKRPTARDPNGRSILAGFPWFSDWGRDTMIALPGLTLTTGRPEIAASILRTYAQFVDQGTIPNRFPDAGEWPEYNTVDATLWYIESLRLYYEATGDVTLIRELFPVLKDIIKWYRRGTRYNIHMDDNDGLIYAGEAGMQLTWMDAKIDDWVVTHRIGKPVEINALWYNALRTMADFAGPLDYPADEYMALAEKAEKGFGRFWQTDMGYCYDVLDGPDGHDGRLRPNQLLAICLPHTPLTPEQQRSALDACGRHLLTAHGLRSLSPDDPEYIAIYGGDRYKRDGAYHQGTVWSWLIGPFVKAHLRIYNNPRLALTYLQPLIHHLVNHGIGSISEIFDGDPPFTPRGCTAQAWSVAEFLHSWHLINKQLMENGER
jgi:predicted glycogen debranching enzyme